MGPGRTSQAWYVDERNGKTHYFYVQFQSLLVQGFTGIGLYQ